MKIHLICIGKTDEKYLIEGIDKFTRRLGHYVPFKITVIPDIKNAKHLSTQEQKTREGELILRQLKPADAVILLDETGVQKSSTEFAGMLNKFSVGSVQELVFVIGGPYGFDDAVYRRSTSLLSLSKMTFSHQMVRLFFVEQLYRAFTILKGEPYHHA